MAHKKGQGSSRNGRDSNAQCRGVKVFGDQVVTAGSILVRQVGTTFHAGNNVGVGKDYTLWAKIDGVVKYERRGKKGKKVSVYPVEESASGFSLPSQKRERVLSFFFLRPRSFEPRAFCGTMPRLSFLFATK